MTLEEKKELLCSLERRIDCGSWDSTDMRLVLMLASMAVAMDKSGQSTNLIFEYAQRRRALFKTVKPCAD